MKTGANKKLEYVMYSKTFRELSLLKSQKKPNNQQKKTNHIKPTGIWRDLTAVFNNLGGRICRRMRQTLD